MPPTARLRIIPSLHTTAAPRTLYSQLRASQTFFSIAYGSRGTNRSAWIAWNALETKPGALYMRSCLEPCACATCSPVVSQPHLEPSISNFSPPNLVHIAHWYKYRHEAALIARNALETKPEALHLRSCLTPRSCAECPLFASQAHLEPSISDFELPKPCKYCIWN